MKSFQEYINESKKVEIKKVSTDHKNVSDREITYDVYVNGKYVKTYKDVNDALDFKEEEEKK